MEDSRDEYLARWEIGLLAVIFLITIIGNFLVLFSLYLRHCHRGRGRKKLTRMYFFIMNLSIADLLNALLNVLPQLAWDVTFRFEGGPVLCKLVKFGQPLPTYLSSYILTATAIDRYQAICHPMSYRGTRSGRRSRAMVYGAWCVAIILCVPQIFVFSYKEIYPDVWDCWASFDEPYGQKAYVTWFGLTVFLIPLTALAYTYARICYGIWNKDGEIAKFARRDNGGDIGAGTCTERNRQPFVSRARLRTARQTVTVVSLYAITSSPFIGCQLWAAWDPNAASSPFFTGQSYAPLFIFYSLKVIHTNTTNFRCNFYDSLSTEQPHQFCESLDLSRFRSRAPCDTRGFFEEKCWIEKFCRSRCVVERLTRSGRSLDEKLAFPANRNKIQLLEQRSIGPNKGGTTTYQLRSFLNVLFFRVSTTFPTKCLFL
ncbi:vasopressin V2 receptor-like isoform X1 [Venturia canescens]|uniref:vasopressin V2 receptor-like isoform X1 n=1 Tax=Venturia canescens TaxID=32260 RepID=UPI001C9C4FBF|nr:vasopressin V2 receptor-like isoform X1 [Venturia canescens]XP_043273570.1 vasopressin V2 receptor-like isoform X1 [Venturia canescens]XP_043273571.1 vasopressin V2 receptor-like isoform X1 [Venturia canescens]